MSIALEDHLNALQDISSKKFVQILKQIQGKKDLIIEQKLMKILDSFIGVSELKANGVDKIFKFAQGLNPLNTIRLYVVSYDLEVCQNVFMQIKSENSQRIGLIHHVLISPFVPMSVHDLLEENGLAGLVSLRPLAWEFIKIDGNVLSLETPLFPDLYYHKDASLLASFSHSLWSLKMVLGSQNFTVAIGSHSKSISNMIKTMDKSLGQPNKDLQIGAMILLDRNQDLVAPLLTPVTYLGLLGEVLDIQMGQAVLGKSKINLDPYKDKVYEEVRDKHFSNAFPTLRQKAKALKSEQALVQSMELAEMKHYVQTNLQKTAKVKQQLEFHISACEAAVNEFASKFEELNSMQNSILECNRRTECLEYILRNIDDYPDQSLRLLMLMSQVSDGVTNSEILPVQKSHLHAHGYSNIPLFYKLETAGALITKEENMLQKFPNWTSKWISNSKKLKLLPATSKTSDATTCPSYVFNGSYIPLVAQILKIVTSQVSDPKQFDELISVTGGEYYGIKGPVHPETIVVCIVGGICYAEISACRLLEKSLGVQLVLVSDSIITGKKIIECIKNA